MFACCIVLRPCVPQPYLTASGQSAGPVAAVPAMFADIMYAKKKHIPGAPRVSPERKIWVKRESASLFARNLLARDKTKDQMFQERMEQLQSKTQERERRQEKWLTKTRTSPFAVDLVAEDERIYEENQIRMREEALRKQRIEQRREKAKNDLILQALSEFSDLEALRREKRAIVEEEQRLRALLSLEKMTQNQKGERLAAERAQRQRAAAKNLHRRLIYKDSLSQVVEEEETHLRMKHSLPPVGSVVDFRVNTGAR